MIRALCTHASLVLFVIASSGQTVFTGTVTDEANAPLAGANVVVGQDQAFGGTTDAAGAFSISGVRLGAHRVRVTYVGYEAIDTTIMIGDGANVFRMRAQYLLIRAAEVTALRAGDRTPFAKTTLTREAIDRMNTGVDLPYLLEQQPGVVATSDGGTGIGYTYMRIRGSDATRTNITVNGVPFNDPESQGAFLVNMPDLATSAEDIEVQRGVGTSTNGPAAFGASVNVRTTSVKKDPWALIGLSGGSYNTQRYSVSAGTGLIDRRFSLDARLSSITTDGYVDRATADLKSYFLQGAWVGEKRSLRLITFRGKEVTYQAWGGVPRTVIDTNRTYNGYTYENEVDNYDQAHYQLLFDQKLCANATLHLTLFRVNGAGYFEQFRADDDLSTYGIDPAVINGDTITTSDIIRRRWLDNTLTGVNLNTEIAVAAHRLVIGGSYSRYEGDHFGEVIWARYAGASDIRDRYYGDDATKTDANAFAKLTYAFTSRMQAFGDAQVRQVEYSYLGYNSDFASAQQVMRYSFFNPKAGVQYHLRDGARAFASVAVGNREPNREDLQQTTPESRPRAERLIDCELGYARRTGRWNLGLNLYYMDYTDQLVLTGALNDVGAALRTNVKDSYRAGAELSLALQLGKRLVWRANAAFSRNRLRDFTEHVDAYDADFNWLGQQAVAYAESDLPYSPTVVAGSELVFRAWEKAGKGQADLSLVTKYVSEQYLDFTASTDRMLDAFVVNDVRANITLWAKGTRGIDVNLTVRNIFSELYESNGWVYSYVYDGTRTQDVGLYPQAPVNVMVGVAVRF